MSAATTSIRSSLLLLNALIIIIQTRKHTLAEVESHFIFLEEREV
jgi:hypothetical protein